MVHRMNKLTKVAGAGAALVLTLGSFVVAAAPAMANLAAACVSPSGYAGYAFNVGYTRAMLQAATGARR